MEVIRQVDDSLAARNWFLVDSSSPAEIPLQSAVTIAADQSSAAPRNWLPPLLASVALTSMISPYIAGSIETYSIHKRWLDFGNLDLDRPPGGSEARQERYSPVIRHIEDVELKLGLTRSQIAQALGVERATLYQWFRGAQPRPRTGDRLELVRQFAEEWSRAGLGSARAAWHLRIPGSTSTLGALLMQEPMPRGELGSFIRHMQSAPKRMEIGPPKQIYGFSAEDDLEQRRREGEILPPSFHGDV